MARTGGSRAASGGGPDPAVHRSRSDRADPRPGPGAPSTGCLRFQRRLCFASAREGRGDVAFAQPAGAPSAGCSCHLHVDHPGDFRRAGCERLHRRDRNRLRLPAAFRLCRLSSADAVGEPSLSHPHSDPHSGTDAVGRRASGALGAGPRTSEGSAGFPGPAPRAHAYASGPARPPAFAFRHFASFLAGASGAPPAPGSPATSGPPTASCAPVASGPSVAPQPAGTRLPRPAARSRAPHSSRTGAQG